GIMANAELGRALGFDLGEVPEVIAKALRRAAIEPSPERRLRDGGAAGVGHALIVVRDARDHVNMRVDVVHDDTLARLRVLPLGVIFERKDLLNAFGPAAALVVQDLQSPANLLQTRVAVKRGGISAPTDAVEDGGQVEEPTTGFEEEVVKGFGGGERAHGVNSCANERFNSKDTRVFRLPERKPSRSRVTKAKPSSRNLRANCS